MDHNLASFNVMIYGAVEPYNDVISRCRVRIFYKGANRNGSFITDEFAEHLLQTLSYTPIKGIYSTNDDDYTDHGTKNEQGRIYGIVPENPNFAWEEVEDENGVKRTYACADVLLFTALYKEANDIVGKPQSMELYSPSIKGQWTMIDGRRLFKFTDGCFLGLQVLGDTVEPCFEGAGFFALCDSLQKLLQDAQNYNKNFTQGGQKMPTEFTFKLSFEDIRGAICALLNSDKDDEGYTVWKYSIECMYSDYALCYNHEDNAMYRVYYTTNEESNEIALGEKVKVNIVDVTDAEKAALDNIKTKNNGNYEKADAVYENLEVEKIAHQQDIDAYTQKEQSFQNQIENLTAEKSEFGQKIEELNLTISTLSTEKENYTTDLQAAHDANVALEAQVQELAAYKHNVETNQKMAVIATYSDKLDADTLQGFTDGIDNYALHDLEKDLAFAWVKSGHMNFAKDPQYGFVPKSEPKNGIEGILSRYTKN